MFALSPNKPLMVVLHFGSSRVFISLAPLNRPLSVFTNPVTQAQQLAVEHLSPESNYPSPTKYISSRALY